MKNNTKSVETKLQPDRKDEDKELVIFALRTFVNLRDTEQDERRRIRVYLSELENSEGRVVN